MWNAKFTDPLSEKLKMSYRFLSNNTEIFLSLICNRFNTEAKRWRRVMGFLYNKSIYSAHINFPDWLKPKQFKQ